MLSPEGRAEEVGESLDQRLSFVQQMLDDMILRQYGLTSAGDLVQYAIGQGWLDESDFSS